MKGLSQLYRDTDTFIAGSSEQGFKRNLSNPSSLSSNGHSASPQQRTRVQKSRKKPREEPSGMFRSDLTLSYFQADQNLSCHSAFLILLLVLLGN